jgi:hypothetical protein
MEEEMGLKGRCSLRRRLARGGDGLGRRCVLREKVGRGKDGAKERM